MSTNLEAKIKHHLELFATTGSSFRGSKTASGLKKTIEFNYLCKTASVENLVGARAGPLEGLLAAEKPSMSPPNYGKVYVDTPTGKAIWITEAENRAALDPILFYLHGGGFVLSTSPTQIKGILSVYESWGNTRLSILAVEYSLSPEVAYPVAISQTAAVYHQLVVQEQNQNVIVLGDSAGGNLAAVLLKHIATPIAEIKPQLPPSARPRAAILISPWINLNLTNSGSYLTNDQRDIITFEVLQVFTQAYQPDAALRQSLGVSPAHSVAEDWIGVFPDHTLIIGGEDEVIIDDITQWVAVTGQQANFKVEPQGTHDALLLDLEEPATHRERYSCKEVVAFLKQL